MKPASTVSTQTFSSVSAKRSTSALSSNLPRYARPRVQAKIEAIGVGRGLLALLMQAVVARHRAVRGLGLHRLAVGRHQHRGHQAERAEALRHHVGLHVAVVVLAGPDEAADPLERRGDHVVDQAVLVGDVRGLELRRELVVEDLLEDVLEAAVIGLEDGVLGREIDRPAALAARN